MSIDNETSEDTSLNTEATSTEDTSIATSDEAVSDGALAEGEASASSTAPIEGANPANKVTQAGQKPADPTAGALPNPKSKPNPTQIQQPQQGQQPVDFRKQLLDEKARWGHERAQMRQQLEAFQQQAQQWESERKRQEAEANRLKLKSWNPQHPESSRTRERLARVDAFMAAMSAATPEQQADPAYRTALARKMSVTAEDAKLHDEWTQNRDHTVAEFSADPEGYITGVARQIAAPMIQQALQQFQTHMQAVQEVQRDLGDMAAIKPYAPMLAQALQNGVPYEYALKMVAQQRELEQLKAGAGSAQRMQQSADERVRLQKQGASMTRDPRGAGMPDLYELAKKEADKDGISYDSPKFMKILSRLEASLKNT